MFGIKKNQESTDEVKAFLGSGTEFNGKLVFSGSVRIDGYFKGDVLGGGLLISGEGSRIEGNIVVDNFLISGDVFGKLLVKDRIEIDSKGRLYGDIASSVFIVQEGAIFEGNCRMSSPQTEKKQNEKSAMDESENKSNIRSVM